MLRSRQTQAPLTGSRLLIVALLAAVATPALADWKQDYARGVEAAREGRWDDVERYMQSALAGNATPAARLRLYGQRYETYAPQHYAGLAALRKGDCASALRYWSQGGNETFIAAYAELAAQEREGRNQCGNRTAGNDTSTPPTEKDATVAKTTPPTEQPTRPPTRPVAEPPPTRPVADESGPSSKAIDVQILRPLVDAYLSGRYNDVLKLSTSVPPTSKLRWHMLTLRAAAAYTLAELGQSKDASRIARQAADDARKSDPSRKPDSTFFSPRFVRFYSGQ